MWGTICERDVSTDSWPKTFCTDLGYDRAKQAIQASLIMSGPANKQVKVKPVGCLDIMQCLNGSMIGCGHLLDVAIQCE